MKRSLPDLLGQVTTQHTDTLALKVRKKRGHIVSVGFPSRTFRVLLDGYGTITAQADPSVQFGTFARPLVFRGNDVLCEFDETTQQWIARTYEATQRCVPDETVNAPFVPPTTYTPPLDTSTLFEPFRVDTNFNPHNIAMGQIIPTSSMPPSAGGFDKSPKLIGVHQPLADTNANSLGYLIVRGDILFSIDAQVDGDSDGHIYIFDVSQPSAPKYLSSITIATMSGDCNVLVSGNYLYTGSISNIIIYDISDLHNPALVSTTASTLSNGTIHLFSISTSTYLALQGTSGGNEVVKVYDVTTPASPSLAGTSATTTAASDMCLGYGSLYFVFKDTGTDFEIIDCSNPASPSIASTTAIGGGWSGGFAAQDGLLFVGMASGNIKCYDISNIASPSLLSTFSANPDIGSPFPIALFADGRFLYVLDFGNEATGGLIVFDIKTPASPSKVGTVLTKFYPDISGGLWVSNNHIFIKSDDLDNTGYSQIEIYGC